MDAVEQLRHKLGKEGAGLIENMVMKDKMPFGLSGTVEYYFVAESIDALVQAIRSATDMHIPWVVVGSGYRTIISELGFQGLVIHNRTKNIVFSPEQSQVIVESGVLTPRLIMEAIARDLGGLEFLVEVYGTLGGALWFNAGQFGYEISKFVKHLTICFPDGTIESHPAHWFRFNRHRHRLILKRDRLAGAQPIFLSVVLQLHSAKKYELIRRIQFYRKQYSQNVNHRQIIMPLFDAPEYGGGVEDLLKKYFSGGNYPKTKNIRILPSVINAIELKQCKSQEIRQWCESVKQEVRENTGIMLEELLTYVGQW